MEPQTFDAFFWLSRCHVNGCKDFTAEMLAKIQHFSTYMLYLIIEPG